MGRKKVPTYSLAQTISSEERLRQALKLFELDRAAQILDKITMTAEKEKLSYYAFLERLFEEELNKKEDSRIERWIKQAKFPWTRKLSEYDFDFPTEIDKKVIMGLSDCHWIETGGNVIFLGPPGVGKTHLSVALGIEAIEKGYETRFISAERTIEVINEAIAKDKEFGNGDAKKRLLSFFLNINLLILDDFTYSTVEPEVGKFLFQIVFRRNETHKSMIFTANHPFKDWDPNLFGDETRKKAAIDRLLEGGKVISIKGDSYRTKNLVKPR